MKGFTIIELLVTLTIIVLVTGVSVAGYLRYNENRQLDNDARNFVVLVNKIRSKATFLEFPEGCTGFQSFTVNSGLNGAGERKVLNFFANCSSGVSSTVAEEILSASVFQADFSLVFLAQSGYLQSQADQTVVLQSTKGIPKTKSIIINQFMGSKNVINSEE